MLILNLLRNSYNILCKVISPPFCAYCRKLIDERTVLCLSCMQQIKPTVSHKLELTKNRTLIVHALSSYEEPLRTLILQKNNQSQQASFQLGRLMAMRLRHENLNVDYFVPIPLHWTRYARRGFNQAEVIASELAKKYRVPVCMPLKRKKLTAYQSYYAGSQRFDNVKDAFKIKKSENRLTGKHIVLVDDLMTTGATLCAAAKKLIPLNPASITALVACRVT